MLLVFMFLQLQCKHWHALESWRYPAATAFLCTKFGGLCGQALKNLLEIFVAESAFANTLIQTLLADVPSKSSMEVISRAATGFNSVFILNYPLSLSSSYVTTSKSSSCWIYGAEMHAVSSFKFKIF
ncbi:hypothetical protein MFRU_047g00420 [Monilinia fructicola]|nr:hypothetical protein MFRU_047g00420 [Monilinia fructicola]